MKEPSLPLYAADAAELDLPLLLDGLLTVAALSLPGNLKRGWEFGMVGGGAAGWKTAS